MVYSLDSFGKFRIFSIFVPLHDRSKWPIFKTLHSFFKFIFKCQKCIYMNMTLKRHSSEASKIVNDRIMFKPVYSLNKFIFTSFIQYHLIFPGIPLRLLYKLLSTTHFCTNIMLTKKSLHSLRDILISMFWVKFVLVNIFSSITVKRYYSHS